MKQTTSLLAGISLLVFNACTPTMTPATKGSAWDKAVSQGYNSLASAKMADLHKLNIPILQSSSVASKWGSPKIEMSATGYRLSYADPSQSFERLVVYGSKTPFPVLAGPPTYVKEKMVNGELTGVAHTQPWRSAVSIAGNSVRWFMQTGSGGADGAYYSTEGFAVTANGKTGYFRLVAESGEGAATERKISRWFKTVR